MVREQTVAQALRRAKKNERQGQCGGPVTAHGGVEANGVGDDGGGRVKEKSSSADEGGPKKRVWKGDLGEDEKGVGVGGDAVVGEAAKEMGDEKVAVVKAEAEDAAMGLAELVGAGGGNEGCGEEGLESRAGEERGREG